MLYQSINGVHNTNFILAVVGDGSVSGIGFYQTTDAAKTTFVQVLPPKPPEKKE
jgi:hypothetical protein